MMKKLILAAAGLALSAPVLADQGHRNNRGHGYGHDRHVVVHKHHYVQHSPAPVYHAPVYHYRPAPRPVYVVRHAPPPPAVVVPPVAFERGRRVAGRRDPGRRHRA